jgi:hypothetical protein
MASAPSTAAMSVGGATSCASLADAGRRVGRGEQIEAKATGTFNSPNLGMWS